jgi:hypothetical protein
VKRGVFSREMINRSPPLWALENSEAFMVTWDDV